MFLFFFTTAPPPPPVSVRSTQEEEEWERLAAAEPVTVVLVTHDRQEALRLAQHWVVLEAGRVVQAGSPTELAAAPATPFVEELLRGGP